MINCRSKCYSNSCLHWTIQEIDRYADVLRDEDIDQTKTVSKAIPSQIRYIIMRWFRSTEFSTIK